MDLSEFHREIEEVALGGFKRLNGSDHVEHKKYDTPVGTWEVSVVRGKVLEKATLARIRFSARNPLTGEDTKFDVVQAKAYPASPKIPILLFNVENRNAKEDKLAGMLDVVPVAGHQEDLDSLQAGIKGVAAKHGVDYQALNKRVQNIYKMDQWEKGYNAGIGIYLGFTPDQFEVVREATRLWLTSYFAIVEKRQKESYGKEDEALMNSVRARILEYYLLGDMSITFSTKLGVPLEALTLQTLAPRIQY
jgi:coproporphyrinogen III oxidase